MLIVEDTRVNRLLLQHIMENLGFQTRVAVNGQEAITIWREWQPHLIFMDVHLPILDGYEATRTIKAEARGPSPIIVALTAVTLQHEQNSIRAAGCDDLVSKPFRLNDIYDVFVRHLGVQFICDAEPASTPEQHNAVMSPHE
ncbi:MAG: response regulator [Chloroflexaceae bacterium]|nr:response regulator [Chloroflexaceae bacterium]